MGRAEDAVQAREESCARRHAAQDAASRAAREQAEQRFQERRMLLIGAINGEVEALAVRLDRAAWQGAKLLKVRTLKWKRFGLKRYHIEERAAFRMVASYGGDEDDWPTRWSVFITSDRVIRNSKGEVIDLCSVPFDYFWNADPVEALLAALQRSRHS